MPRRTIDLGPTTGPLNDLLGRVAARDRAAFGAFFSRLVKPTFLQARTALGDTGAAVAVTRATFVEVWLRAPGADLDDALGWLSAIATRRVADRLRVVNHHRPSPIGGDYDAHIGEELAAMLNPDPHAAFVRIGIDPGGDGNLSILLPDLRQTGRHHASAAPLDEGLIR